MVLSIIKSGTVETSEILHGTYIRAGYIYTTDWNSPARVFKIETETLSTIKKATLPSGWNWGNDITEGNGYLWVALYYTNDFKIARISPADLSFKAAINESNKKWYPMALASNKTNRIWCGTVENLIEIDISNPDSVTYNTYSVPGKYCHSLCYDSFSGNVIGYCFSSFDVSGWKPTGKARVFIFSPSSKTFKHVDIDNGLTDDCVCYNGKYFGVSEAWDGEPWSAEAVIYRVGSDLSVASLKLDSGKVGLSADTMTVGPDKKIYAGWRNETYPLTVCDTDLKNLEYLHIEGVKKANEMQADSTYLYVICSEQNGYAKIYKMGTLKTINITFSANAPAKLFIDGVLKGTLK